MRALTMGLLMVALAGCGAKKAYKSGLSLVETGQIVPASEKFLEALDRGYEDARPELAKVAEKSWSKRYAQASELEEANKYEKARDQYLALARFEDRLERYDLLDFDRPVDADAKAAEMAEGAAERDYALGEQARVAGRFSEAIDYFRKSQGHVANFKDSSGKIGQSWMEWGDALKAGKRWRDAAAKYDEAGAIGILAGDLRSAEIYAALGQYFLDTGACRQAVRDFEAANERATAVDPDDLEWARACSERRVVIHLDALNYRDRRKYANTEPVVRLEQGFTATLPAEASPYLRLVGVDMLDQAPRTRFGTPTVHRIVTGRILGGELGPLRPVRQPAEGPYTRVVPCPEGSAETRCTQERTYSYELVEDRLAASMALALEVIDGPHGSYRHGAWTFETQAVDTLWYVDDVRDSESGQAVPRELLPDEVTALMDASREHVADADLWRMAVDELVDEATPWLASLVDAEEQHVDPSDLKIESLGSAMSRPR